MKKNNNFVVPKRSEKKYFNLVQRANRRIKANIEFIEKENELREQKGLRPLSDTVVRSLLHDYYDKTNWAGSKTVFSRKTEFTSKREYQQTIRHLEEWGKKDRYLRNYDTLQKQYAKSVIKSLTSVAINSGLPILTKSGKLPGNLANTIRGMTLEQLSHYFKEADPAEDLEYKQYHATDYIGLSGRDEFLDITISRLNDLKQIYPLSPAGESILKTKPKKKAKKKKAKAKKKK